MRETYVLRAGRLVPKRLASPLPTNVKSVHVISDAMEPTKHMATGRIHTSKAKFRADTRATGCEEVGTDRQAPRARPEPSVQDIAADVRRAMQELNSR